MRIAVVCPYDWSAHGGVRSHVASLCGELARRHDVAILAPASAPLAGEDPLDAAVHVVGRAVAVPFNRSVARIAASPLAGRRTLATLRDLDPDVVHVHEPGVPAVALAAAQRGPQPVVGTFHAWSDRDRLYRSTGPYGRHVARALAARLAVSEVARHYHAAALGLPPSAFEVVPNGVEVGSFATAEPLAEYVDPERPTLLFVGRLEPRKGLDVLIRAFLELRSRRPELRLVVLGDGPERARCERLLPVAVRPDVLFLGAVDEADKARFHASADLFVAPNLGGESFGIVLLEAMAAGLPVVASAIPGFESVMADGREGRLVAPGDGFALAEAVTTLLDDPEARAAMAARGRETAERHAWPRVAERVEEVYRAVAQPAD
ncbi:MAG: glycosyltransferase family 4 protein [Egibacteraceae bacterium]